MYLGKHATKRVYNHKSIQVCNYKGTYVCNYARMMVCMMCLCNYAGKDIELSTLQALKYENIHLKRIKVYKCAGMHIFKCVGIPLCMYANMQICQKVNMKEKKYASF